VASIVIHREAAHLESGLELRPRQHLRTYFVGADALKIVLSAHYQSLAVAREPRARLVLRSFA